MLKIEDSFFQDEVREGFLVEEKMKRAWAVEMDVLSEIIRVCEKYNLTYYADWGTLLGTVRHHGFIPWDDDMDIALKRADYNKLLAVLPKELPEGFVVSSFYTDPTHCQPISAVMNTKTIITDPEIRKRFYGCPYIVGVDIVALDYLPREEELLQLQLSMYSMVYSAAREFDAYKASGEIEGYLAQIEELCNVKIRRDGTERNQLWRLSDSIAAMFTEEESDDLAWMPRLICSDPNFRLKKEWYQDVISMPFEQMKLHVPVGYDSILTTMYGDYRTPINRSGGHDYPFYKKQDLFLEKIGVTI